MSLTEALRCVAPILLLLAFSTRAMVHLRAARCYYCAVVLSKLRRAWNRTISSKSSLAMQRDIEKLYDAVGAATGKDEFAARSDVELAILCDLADLLSPYLDADQSAALEVAKQRPAGTTEELRDFHLEKLTQKMDQLFHEIRTGKATNRLESINRIVWAALRKRDGFDASHAEFFVEISLEAGLEPAAISGVYKKHIPNFIDPFDAAR